MTKAIIVRDDGTIAAAGLRLIEQYASEHKSQRTIAAALGISLKRFEKMLERNKGDNEIRMAWERGFAEAEQGYIDMMKARAFGGIQMVPELDEEGMPIMDAAGEKKLVRVLVPATKDAAAFAIFYAKAKMGWQEKPSGGMVQDNRIQITMNEPMKFGEMLTAFGQKGIADFRKDKTIPLKDVTPGFAKVALPEPVKEDVT